MPAIESMRNSIFDFGAQNMQMKEMIRRFDEVISDKASKSQLVELEYQIDQGYVKKKYWDKL